MPNFEGEVEIPFVPNERDVVSTKLRNWTLQHQGNLDYADLLNEYAEMLPNPADASHTAVLKEYSERIVHIISEDRQGRFLKLSEGETDPHVCILMTKRGAVHKVMNGLKNKQISLLKRLGKPIPASSLVPVKPKVVKSVNSKPKAVKTLKLLREKTKLKQQKKATAGNSSDTATSASKSKKRKPNSTGTTNTTTKNASPPTKPRITKHYEAQCGTNQEGDTSNSTMVHPYALELVSHVCNNDRISSINNPLRSRYSSPEEEPDRERMIRMQLRHRFHSAVAIQMPVVVFARKLVEDIWGGRLVETEIVRKPPASDDGDLPMVSNSQGTSDPVRAASAKRNDAIQAGPEDNDEEETFFSTDQIDLDAPNSPDPYRRDYYHDGSGNSGSGSRRRRASQKFMDALEDEDAVGEAYGWRSRRFMDDEFYDARESVQDSMPSLHTATSSLPKSKSKKKKRKAPSISHPQAPAPKKPAGMRGSRIACFTWADRMVQLQEYKDLFGHLKVPTAKKGKYYTLGAWLAAQKSLYKKGTLKKERLADLRALGCVGFGGPAG